MDPDACLAEIRALVKEVQEAPTLQGQGYYAADLAERVDALDEWLTKGGFVPAAWRPQK